MSLAGLANNYVLRTSGKPEGQNPSLGPKRTPNKAADTLPNVPQGFSNQLVRWIPTEALSVYAAIAALVGAKLTMHESLAIYGVAAVIGLLYLWAAAVLKVAAAHGIPENKSKWGLFFKYVPRFELVMGTIAFTLWISALPDSWPTHLSWWHEWLGAVGVILAAAVIPLIARISGKTPSATEISPE